MISLSKAQKTNRLDEFIAEQEAHGVGPIGRHEFSALIKQALKQPKSRGRTSDSRVRGGSSGKKTP